MLFFALSVLEEDCEVELSFVLSLDEELQAAIVSAAVATVSYTHLDVYKRQEEIQKAVVTGVEMFRKQLDEGLAGDNVGVLLRGIQRDEIERGQVIAKPGSILSLIHICLG